MAHARKLESFTPEFRTLLKTVRAGNPVQMDMPDRASANRIRQDVSSLRLTYERMAKLENDMRTKEFWLNEYYAIAGIEVVIQEQLPGKCNIILRQRGDNPAMRLVAEELQRRQSQGIVAGPLNPTPMVGGVALPDTEPAPANIAASIMAVEDEGSIMDDLIMRRARLASPDPAA